MACLRNEVRQLEENELFERTLLRGSQVALEELPSTADIDALMRSMMVAPQSNTVMPYVRQQADRNNPTGVTSGPWSVNGHDPWHVKEVGKIIVTSGIKAGKRRRNGSSRNLVA